MNVQNKVNDFFDKRSLQRDIDFFCNPVLGFEQEQRHITVITEINAEINDKVLEVGCGTGKDALILDQKTNYYYGIDISKGMLEKCKKKIPDGKFIYSSGTNLPFKDSKFTKILCSEIIEHIPNYIDVLKEIFRVLDKEGEFVLTTPNKNSLYELTEYIDRKIRKVFKKKKKNHHPYDEWKSIKDLLKELNLIGFKIISYKTIIFLPGTLTHRIPCFFKNLFIKLFFPIEKFLQKMNLNFGYIIVIKAKKNG